jgi:hypothetical protein
MRIYELHDQRGRVFAFEIGVPWGGRRRVCSIVRKIPGARVIRAPRLLSWFREEAFCQFEIGGVRFQALEPFGDNSRYWIGPTDAPRWHPETEAVLRAFAGASLRGRLARYGQSDQATEAVAPILAALERGGATVARPVIRREIAGWCDLLERGQLTPSEADERFTLLYLHLAADHGVEDQLGPELRQVLLEGMTLHHLGGDWGGDLETIRGLLSRAEAPH